MSDDRSGADGQPHGDHQTPPYGHGTGDRGAVQPQRPPLAPPLYTPPPAEVPPYAQSAPVGASADAPYGGQPGAPFDQWFDPSGGGAPPAPKASGKPTLVILAIVAALVIIGGFLGVGMLTSVLSSTGTSQGQGVGGGEEREEEPSGDGADTAFADTVQQKIDEYRAARDDGSLWEQIPDTDFNRTALVAFLFFLTDMKVAATWGIDSETAAEYEQEITELERRLLAEEPLGSDIEIAFSEDRIFRYDGETGEGGYFQE